MWLSNLLRSLFFFLDELIYGLIDKVYGLFIEIANTTIFTNDMIDQFAGKVYALVGIFMLFKVSFSILTYIVNPDEFADKGKGMNKLISNIVTSLVLLIIVPFIFEQAMDIQRIILKDDIIPKLFSTEKINISSQDPDTGSQMALITFSAFYSRTGYTTLNDIFNSDVNETNSNGEYVANYDYLISTVVGIVMVLLIVSFCFDIALRSIKFGCMQLLAPVPIIARVDPKKGNDIFNKWVKTCISTYLDLFVRLIAIFFAIYIIKAINQSFDNGSLFVDAVTGEASSISPLTMAFIILGALMFAKQLPKLIEDLLGIKLGGGKFTLNPIKRLSEVPIVGKPLAATTQFAGRTAANVVGAGAHVAKEKLLSPVKDSISETSFGQKFGQKYENFRDGLKNSYSNINMATGGRLDNIASDFNSTIGAIGRSVEDDLGLYESRDRLLSNREASILERQSKDKEIMQKNKTVIDANDAVLDRAKKKVSESVEYAKYKAEVDRLKSVAENTLSNVNDLKLEKAKLDQEFNSYDAEYNTTTDEARRAYLANKKAETQVKLTQLVNNIQQVEQQSKMEYNIAATQEAKFNKWANKDGVFEYIDKTGNFAGRGDDAVLDGLINKRDETARALSDSKHNYVQQFVGVDAKTTDDNGGNLKGENTSIESKFVKDEQELYEIKEQKRQLQEERRAVGDYRKIGGPRGK